MRRILLASLLVLCPVAVFAANIVFLDCNTNPIALGEKVIFKAVQNPPPPPPFMQFEWFWRCSMAGSGGEISLGITNNDAREFLPNSTGTQRMKVTGLVPLPTDTEMNDFTVMSPSGYTLVGISPNPSAGDPEMRTTALFHVYCGHTKKMGIEPSCVLFVRFRPRSTMVWSDTFEVGGFESGHFFLSPEIHNTILYVNDGVFFALPDGTILDDYDQQYIFEVPDCTGAPQEYLLDILHWQDVKVSDAIWERRLVP